MAELKRPDPDALLKRIQAKPAEPASSRAGRLKIFLGANAGVGKTFRMLSQARIKRGEGLDVVIGIAETHGRKETEALLEGLEIIPRKKIEYGGLTLEEMDLDTILARRPKLVLVDELAHTNAPGSRHPKRYQDVEELLNAGIDVYTTLNIQHVESLNDVVYQITGVRVQETVPDSVVEIAKGPDEVELVDLTPNELQQRMIDGKVYVPQKARQATDSFFRPGNLIALREMALRYVARLVDEDMRTYMEQHDIQGPWAATTRILACVGTSGLSEQVIRLAKQLSSGIDAEWFAVHVQSPLQPRLSESAQDRLTRNLQLAESLGGKVSVLTGHNMAEQILTFARAHNISFILIGWTPRWGWRRLFRGSLSNALVRESGSVHVMVVTGQAKKPTPGQAAQQAWRRGAGWPRQMRGTALVALTVLACLLAGPWLNFMNTAMLLLLAVVASGSLWGMQSGALASIFAVLALDFFFMKPHFSFAVSDLQYLPTFLIFVLVGIATSFLADLARSQEESARQSERFVSSLYDFSRQLLDASNLDQVLQNASNAISEAFNCEVQILLPDGMGNLQVRASVRPADNLNLPPEKPQDTAERVAGDQESKPQGSFYEHEWGVAAWAFQHGKPAGRGTETLSSAKFRFIPLKRKGIVVGVMGVRLLESEKHLKSDQLQLLDSFANIVAVALARILRLS